MGLSEAAVRALNSALSNSGATEEIRSNLELLEVTAGTATASKPVVLDANSKIDTLDITAPKINGVSMTAGAEELNSLDRSAIVSHFDDFLGDTLDDFWIAAKGSNGNGAVAVLTTIAAEGVVTLVAGDDAGGVITVNGSGMTGETLQWKALVGLTMEVRLKVDAITKVDIAVGFTDVAVDTTLELPATISGPTVVAIATNAACLVFDTDALTDQWYAVGVDGGDTAGSLVTGIAPVATVYTTLRVECVSVTGTDAKFDMYIDGVDVGTVNVRCAQNTLLTPVVVVNSEDDTATHTLTVDYAHVWQNRP